jgi:glyoxylase-like metal-dependent hydrolase (beta-lactamase superfamily II)
VREILLTHHHQDHIGGVAHLRDRLRVPVAAHARTAALVAGAFRVDRHIADGELLLLDRDTPGERRLRAVFTPGHAPGHLCFLDEVTQTMIAGDMVAGVGFIVIDPPEGDMRLYLDSLARMKALAPRALYPAHGLPIADPIARLDEYVAHRLAREAKVAGALGNSAALVADLLPVVYSDTPPLMYPIAARSLLAHLLKLQADGRAREAAPGRWARAA